MGPWGEWLVSHAAGMKEWNFDARAMMEPSVLVDAGSDVVRLPQALVDQLICGRPGARRGHTWLQCGRRVGMYLLDPRTGQRQRLSDQGDYGEIAMILAPTVSRRQRQGAGQMLLLRRTGL